MREEDVEEELGRRRRRTTTTTVTTTTIARHLKLDFNAVIPLISNQHHNKSTANLLLEGRLQQMQTVGQIGQHVTARDSSLQYTPSLQVQDPAPLSAATAPGPPAAASARVLEHAIVAGASERDVSKDQVRLKSSTLLTPTATLKE